MRLFHARVPHVPDVPLLPFSVYDWLQRKRISQFFNGNPHGTSITSLYIINQDIGGIILTAAGTPVVLFLFSLRTTLTLGLTFIHFC